MPENKYKGIFIGIPNYTGEIQQETHASLTTLIRFLEKNNIKNTEYLISMAGPAEVRNHILTHFYDATDFEHLLMIDDDMQFMPNMIARMLNFNKPIIGAVYHKRQLPNQGDPWSAIVGSPLDEGLGEIVDGFQQWKMLGAGVLLIKRDCITKMINALPEIVDYAESNDNSRTGISRLIRAFDEIKVGNSLKMSEDNSFCHRWRVQCGGEIWAAVDFPIGHIGKFNYCINPAEHLGLKKEQEEKKNQSEPKFNSKADAA